MNNCYIRFLIAIALISTSTSAFAGGPWPQPKYKGYFKLSEYWIIYDEHFTDAGKTDPNVTTGIFNTNFYGEFGLTDRLTVLTDATLFSRNYMNNLVSATTGETIVEGEALNSIGDITIGAKYGLIQGDIPLSVSILFGLPTGDDAGGTQNNLQTGDGEFNQILQLDAGKSLTIGNYNAYASIYAGVNNRTNDFSDELRLGGEFGIGLISSQLWLSLKINVVESFKNGASAAEITSSSIFANNVEYGGIGVEANYYIFEKFGVSANVSGAFRGEVLAAAPAYSLGIFYDMNR